MGRVSRWMKAPLRVLGRARDFYVRSMIGCSGHAQYGAAAMGYPAVIPSFPESYCGFQSSSARTSASEEDLRELIRAASARVAPLAVRKSQSVAIGRIDEDKPCSFDGDVEVGSQLLFPRSRSCAVGGTRRPARVVCVTVEGRVV